MEKYGVIPLYLWGGVNRNVIRSSSRQEFSNVIPLLERDAEEAYFITDNKLSVRKKQPLYTAAVCDLKQREIKKWSIV